jgi:hypothetical protein
VSRRLAVAALALAFLGGTPPALAQVPHAHPPRPIPRQPKPKPKLKKPAPGEKRKPLMGLVGLGVAKRLLESSNTAERQRGLERLGSVGTSGALEILTKSIEPGGAAKTSEERLIAVRALAARTDNADVRLALVRALAGVGAASGAESAELERLVRETAALALARSGRRESLELLSKALRQEGPVAEAAAIGLEAHPPADIAPLLESRGAPTLTFVRLLGRLGDQRAFHALRQVVKRGAPEVRAQAAVALTELGDFETVELARHWLGADAAPSMRIAAARILSMARAPGADKAIAGLLADDEHYAAGLELALDAALPGLVAPLERLLRAHAEDAGTILAAIGRSGGTAASEALVRQLPSPTHGALAAYALALTPGDAAEAAIERALAAEAPTVRRNAARAAVLRRRALSQSVSGTDAALERLLASADPSDRAAGAWGRALLDESAARALIGSKDPHVARAVARQAFSPALARTAAARLAKDGGGELRSALASSLAVPRAASEVPTAVLIALVDDAGAATPIAAQALAARDSLELRQRIEPLLGSADALVRASVALGLAESREPSAVGLLERAYRFEVNTGVRHAIVVSLSRRRERSRSRLLSLAAHLDGDRGVREAARVALSGHRLPLLARGRGTLWLSLVQNEPGAALEHDAQVATSVGAVLPLGADPDGAVTVFGLPPGPVRLRLAARARSDKASDEHGPSRARAP